MQRGEEMTEYSASVQDPLMTLCRLKATAKSCDVESSIEMSFLD